MWSIFQSCAITPTICFQNVAIIPERNPVPTSYPPPQPLETRDVLPVSLDAPDADTSQEWNHT